MTDGAVLRVTAVAAPGMASVLGMAIPIAPAFIAVLTAFLVRLPQLMKHDRATFGIDVSVTAVVMIGAFVTVVDHQLTAGPSFWLGIGFGGMGAGIIEIGKAAFATTLRTNLKEAVKVLFGIKDRP